MRLLGGVEDRVVRGKSSDVRSRGEEEEINEEEIKKAIGKLKWKYGGGGEDKELDQSLLQ